MRHTYVFEMGKTNTVSRPFSPAGEVFIVGFNMRGLEYTKNPDGTLGEIHDCDYVIFERLLYDGVYDVTKCDGISEQGIIAAVPVKDHCGNIVKLNHCNNTLWITEPGIYRAVYHGDGRPDAAVVYYNSNGK